MTTTKEKTKVYHYGNSNKKQREHINHLIYFHVHVEQSCLVDNFLEKGIFNIKDVDNFHVPKCENCKRPDLKAKEDEVCVFCKKGKMEIDWTQEVKEWHAISTTLATKLRKIGYIVLQNAYGTWWGRCFFSKNFALHSECVFWEMFQEDVQDRS